MKNIPEFNPNVGLIEIKQHRFSRRKTWEEYDDYLINNPYWQQVRKIIRQRDKEICQRCGRQVENGETHHLFYSWHDKEIIGHEKLNLQYLCYVCPQCHRSIHKNTKKPPYW